MPLDESPLVRSLVGVLVLLAPVIAFADAAAPPPTTSATKKLPLPDDALWQAELRLGWGYASRGTMDHVENGASPLSITALGAVAINQEPLVYAYGGVMAEVLQRSAVGATAGARLQLRDMPVRMGAGGVMMFAPATLWGAQASGGACKGKGTLALCGDVQFTAYFAGTGLDNDKTELQVQLVLGVVARGGH